MVQASNGYLYTGIAKDPQRRFQEHCDGKKGAKFFRRSEPKAIVYQEPQPDRSQASSREIAIKKMTRAQKLRMIADYERTRTHDPVS